MSDFDTTMRSLRAAAGRAAAGGSGWRRQRLAMGGSGWRAAAAGHALQPSSLRNLDNSRAPTSESGLS